MWNIVNIVGFLLLLTISVEVALLCKQIFRFKKLILNTILFSCAFKPGYSQQTSKNNYTGAWETPASWTPTWASPTTNVSGTNITINGYITVNGALSCTGSASTLIINDTLVVKGDLTLGSNIDLIIQNGGVIIVEGNLTAGNNIAIAANSYIVVTGNFSKSGSVDQGSFTTNDNPANVFIGGTISPVGLTNSANFPAINCTSPPTTPYPNSTCSYGNAVDLVNSPIYTFMQSVCTGPVITIQPTNEFICSGSNINFSITATGATSYQWLVNTGSGYIAVSNGGVYSGATNSALTLTAINASYNGYAYRCIASNTTCSTESNAAILNVLNSVPAQPSLITGNSVICAGTSEGYSVVNISGITYTWTYTGTGATITSNGANSISVNYNSSATSGTFSVTPSNSCGNGTDQTLAITINSLPPTTAIYHD